MGVQNMEIKTRGYNFLIPIGRTWTQHEEKNDVSTNPVVLCVMYVLPTTAPTISIGRRSLRRVRWI